MPDPAAIIAQLAQAKPGAPPTAPAKPLPNPTTDTPTGVVDQFANLLDLGGPVVLVLLCLSVVALAIVLLKLYQFFRLQVGARAFIGLALDDWAAGRASTALATLTATRNPIARVLEAAIGGLTTQHGSEALAREESTRVATRELKALGSYLRGLEVIATVAPLLGLLGTVLGMITAFQSLQASGSRADPGVLAGGIWEALLTTAIGLAVAVPTALILSLLESAVDRIHHAMEDALTRVFTARRVNSETPVTPTIQD